MKNGRLSGRPFPISRPVRIWEERRDGSCPRHQAIRPPGWAVAPISEILVTWIRMTKNRDLRIPQGDEWEIEFLTQFRRFPALKIHLTSMTAFTDRESSYECRGCSLLMDPKIHHLIPGGRSMSKTGADRRLLASECEYAVRRVIAHRKHSDATLTLGQEFRNQLETALSRRLSNIATVFSIDLSPASSLALWPRTLRRSAEPARSIHSLTKLSSSSTRTPVRPSTTESRSPDTRKARVGVPCIAASLTTIPHPS